MEQYIHSDVSSLKFSKRSRPKDFGMNQMLKTIRGNDDKRRLASFEISKSRKGK